LAVAEISQSHGDFRPEGAKVLHPVAAKSLKTRNHLGARAGMKRAYTGAGSLVSAIFAWSPHAA